MRTTPPRSPDGLTDAGPAAPGTRPTGQLPTETAGAAETTPLGRAPGLASAWWYTAVGLLVVVLLGYAWVSVPLVVTLLDEPGPEPRAAVAGVVVLVVLTAASLIGQVWAVLALRDRPPRPRAWPSRTLTAALLVPGLALAALGVPLAPATGVAAWLPLPLWLGVCLLACLVPERDRRGVLTLGGAVVLAAAVATGLRTEAGPRDSAVSVAFFLTTVLITVPPTVWFWRLMLRLEEARRQAGDLAVTRERLRFAADLHDVQGHHLQVIALKAELAERLLSRGRAEEAGRALAEVRGIAADALGETRALVRDLRSVSLADELANAADVLAAAGADVEVRVDPTTETLAGAAGRALGLAVREATTNVLRHARPHRVEVVLEPEGAHAVRLTVRNDGVPDVDASARADPHPAGTGLTALADRAAALGGRAETVHEGGRFTLTVTVPREAAREEER